MGNYDSPKSKAKPTRQKGIIQSTHGEVSGCSFDGEGDNLDVCSPTSVQNPTRWCDMDVRHSIRSIIEHPQFELSGVLTTGTTNTQLIVHPCAYLIDHLKYASYGYMAYFAQYFRRWRGSIIVMLKFTTSAFVTGRVEMGVTFGNEPSGSANIIGDLPSKLLTIKGNAEVVWEIPYLRTAPWMPCNADESEFPGIFMKVRNIFGSGDRTPSIMYQYWIKPGPDFIFDGLQAAYQDTATPSPKFGRDKVTATTTKQKKRESAAHKPKHNIEGQCDVNAAFAQVEPITGFKRVVPIRWDFTFEDMLSRWSDRQLTPSTAFAYERNFIPAPGVRSCNWDSLNWLFLFNSGSVRHKLFTESTTGLIEVFLSSSTAGNEIDQPEIVDSGSAATDVSRWPVLDFCAPYIALQDVQLQATAVAQGAYPDDVWIPYTSSRSVTLSKQWIKAGKNYQVFHLIPPPDRQYWPYANKYVPPPSPGFER